MKDRIIFFFPQQACLFHKWDWEGRVREGRKQKAVEVNQLWKETFYKTES